MGLETGGGPLDALVGTPFRMLGLEPANLPVVGGLFHDPAERAHAEQMRNVAEGWGTYRPEMAQAQTNALQNSMAAFGPANNMLGMMYGPQAQFDFATMGQNPMPPGMSSISIEPPPHQGYGFQSLLARWY